MAWGVGNDQEIISLDNGIVIDLPFFKYWSGIEVCTPSLDVKKEWQHTSFPRNPSISSLEFI